MEKVTIYSAGGMFGVHKYEAKLIEHGRKKYAQYDAAPYVHFIEKGKRTPKAIVKADRTPYLLILKGWEHPSPDDPFVPSPSSTPGVTCKRSRYASCDPRWESDFNALINPYLAARPGAVVADYRHTTEGGAA